MSDITWHVVAAVSELDASPQLHVNLDGEDMLLVREEGSYYAIAWLCSHEAFSLEGGVVQGGCITCPYHGAEFSLKDGSVLAPPAHEPISTWPVKVEDGIIAVGVPLTGPSP